MNEDLHNIEYLFRTTLDHYEERPSPMVKKNLNAQLDKLEAIAYKRKYEAWKRIAILMLLVLVGFILYDSKPWKIHSGTSNENTNANISGPSMVNQQNKTAKNDEIINHQIAKKTFQSYPVTTLQKKHWVNRRINNIYKTKQIGITVIDSSRDKEFTNSPKGIDSFLPANATPIAINKNFSTIKEDIQLINSMRRVPDLNFSKNAFPTNGEKNKNKGKHRTFSPFWTITGTASYEQVNYKLDSDLPNAITNIKHREVHEPSFAAGIQTARQFKEHWGLQTGLVYGYTAIGISPQKIYAYQEPAGSVAFKYITSSGYAYIKPGLGAPPAVGDSLNTAESKHTLRSLSVPLVIKYIVEKDKFSIRPGIGIEANLLTSAKVEVELENVPGREMLFINQLNGARSFYWSLSADADIQYNINNNLRLSIRPAFRHALTPITEDNVVETFPYSFGVGIGMSYQFR